MLTSRIIVVLVLTGLAAFGALNPVVLAQPALDIQKKPIEVVSPRDGVILVVKLKAGDRVEADQIIARLDDRLAQIDVERARSKLSIAQLELEASRKTLDEAVIRYEIGLKIRGFLAEEIREKKLTVERFQLEVNIKKEVINLAKYDVRTAEIKLDMHVIRSPVRGVIRVIRKSRGEGIKSLEPIMEIVPDKE